MSLRFVYYDKNEYCHKQGTLLKIKIQCNELDLQNCKLINVFKMR